MTTSGSAFVNFIDVQKSYDGETLVVKDMNLSIRRGEFLTLLGPSGSGKTTTLMMLAGFEMPTEGRILLEGRDIAHTAPHRRGIGVVPAWLSKPVMVTSNQRWPWPCVTTPISTPGRRERT